MRVSSARQDRQGEERYFNGRRSEFNNVLTEHKVSVDSRESRDAELVTHT